jgi:hypothetical protein
VSIWRIRSDSLDARGIADGRGKPVVFHFNRFDVALDRGGLQRGPAPRYLHVAERPARAGEVVADLHDLLEHPSLDEAPEGIELRLYGPEIVGAYLVFRGHARPSPLWICQ